MPSRSILPGRSRLAAAGLAVTALTLAACGSGSSSGSASGGGGSYGFKQAKQSAGSGITVWIDADRSAAAAAYKAANPSDKVTVVTYDGSANGSGSFKTKMALYDRSGSGWPDVVFSSQNNDASWASQGNGGKQPYAAVLNQGLVPQGTISSFTQGSLDPCTVGGKVYCLRNDLAQVVLWYDKSLMTKFGYTVPTTWEEFQQLGAKVAKEHPGYIVGDVGDTWTPEIYMWGSQCQANQVTGARSVTVNTATPECQRAAALIDAGVANKSLSTTSVFTPEFVKQFSGKVLAMPGPAWFAGAIFNNPSSLNLPKGRLGVAPPPAWGSSAAVTGDVGGGTWFVSSHSKDLALASKFAQFVTTADAYQVEKAPGYPAYGPAAQKWLAKQESSGYYATDLSALTAAGKAIWSGWGSPAFSQEAVWAKVMSPIVTSGGSVASNLDKWGQAIKDQAKITGYDVK
ncbi:carbohydrate ABC transporter substrate-binding protein (CUT1 family) [Motilibacter rhizosphaerae]|uniref:Carbohydrate ABC transporter substrate-binding protein (CUT1 family) n=1 Tax=Motilibacter rhizosphaerae TaxID=598652 RepID=A0A4Q7NWI8_9ACTN|nr:extracellular solute-binding protein [Motilibacter rhizosphaerae]RZS91661.1 carbohydrate ABC transporter substrate-binding protein (CUT1 family) [Motilibacter rhizosphaerae]